MKRILALALSALLLLGVLSGCSTAEYDGMGGYNVSTTRDGRVNGTNPGSGSMVGELADGMTGGTNAAYGARTGMTGRGAASR